MKKRFALNLDRSFYYAASGVDIQPLIRFSHFIDTFIYVNLGAPFDDPATVAKFITDKVRMLQRIYGLSLELESDPIHTHLDEIEHEMPSSNWKQVLPKIYQVEYALVFGQFANEENWALKFDLVRSVGKCRRPLQLFFINGEALATYFALTHNGQFAPKVFCAIQSGRIERKDSPMRDIWDSHQKVPDFWVRGLWGAERWEDQYWIQQAAKPVFCPVNPHPFLCQDYAGWSGMVDPKRKPAGIYAESTAISLVRTFSRKQLCPVSDVVAKSPNGRTRILRRRFKERSAHNWDVAVVPERIASRWQYQKEFRNIPVETIKGPRFEDSALELPAGMKACLSRLDSICSNVGESARVAFIPDAFEDEVDLFTDWAKTRTSACEVDMLLSKPLDYIDHPGDM